MVLAGLFPGQGSQSVGMGKELSESFSAAREAFEEADNCLGFSLSKLSIGKLCRTPFIHISMLMSLIGKICSSSKKLSYRETHRPMMLTFLR